MRTLTLRIYLTVVAVLLLFAFVSSLLFQRHVVSERAQVRLQEQARAESSNSAEPPMTRSLRDGRPVA